MGLRSLTFAVAMSLPFAVQADPAKPVDPIRPTAGPAVAPLHLQLGTKTEGRAVGASPAYRPSTGEATAKAANVGHPHHTTLARFKPGQACDHGGQVDGLARSWKTNLKWDAIVVDGYGAKSQQGADQIRACLVHHGVPADYVVASGHAADETRGATIEVSVTTCDGVTIPCRAQPAPK